MPGKRMSVLDEEAIVVLREAGYTQQAIAAWLTCSVRTVQRVLAADPVVPGDPRVAMRERVLHQLRIAGADARALDWMAANLQKQPFRIAQDYASRGPLPDDMGRAAVFQLLREGRQVRPAQVREATRELMATLIALCHAQALYPQELQRHRLPAQGSLADLPMLPGCQIAPSDVAAIRRDAQAAAERRAAYEARLTPAQALAALLDELDADKLDADESVA